MIFVLIILTACALVDGVWERGVRSRVGCREAGVSDVRAVLVDVLAARLNGEDTADAKAVGEKNHFYRKKCEKNGKLFAIETKIESCKMFY